MKNNWNKYEVKDSSRNYWTIFFHPINLEEAKKNLNTTPGSEGYFHLVWYYFIHYGCTEKFQLMSEKQINKLDNEGVFNGRFEWEADIDYVEKGELWAYAPTAEQFLKDYHDRVTNALMSACSGNIIENSAYEQINKRKK